MTRRSALWTLVGMFMLVGVSGYFVPLLGSLGPNPRGETALPRIDVSALRPGTVALVDDPLAGAFHDDYEYAILFYRHINGEPYAWHVLSEHGAVVMPDWHWWRPSGVTCLNFAPTEVSSGEYRYRCADASIEGWFAKLEWDLQGRLISGDGADMDAVRGQFEGGEFVLAKTAH